MDGHQHSFYNAPLYEGRGHNNNNNNNNNKCDESATQYTWFPCERRPSQPPSRGLELPDQCKSLPSNKQQYVTSQVSDLPFAYGMRVRPSVRSLTILAYQTSWLLDGWGTCRSKGSRNKIIQRVVSGRSPRCLFTRETV